MRRFGITLDAADPRELAEFWCDALGYVMEEPPAGFATWEEALTAWGVPESEWNSASAIVDPDGVLPRIFLQRVPEPKTAKNRVHIDLDSGARQPDGSKDWDVLRATAHRLEQRGATIEREFSQPPQGEWIVMHDPEGNEFCVC
jgi:hypothetical protein